MFKRMMNWLFNMYNILERLLRAERSNVMNCLSNELLIQAYEKAIELQLDVEFQLLLMDELKRRDIIPMNAFHNCSCCN